MRRTSTLTTATIGALALVLGLSACGSSSSSGERATTTEAAAPSGSDSSTTTTIEDVPRTTVVATRGGEFCQDVADYINDGSLADVDSSDPVAYKADLDKAAEEAQALLDSAPEELKGALTTLVKEQNEVIDALAKVDYDYSKLPDDAFEGLSTEEMGDAADKLQDYGATTCGIDALGSAPADDADATTTTAAP